MKTFLDRLFFYYYLQNKRLEEYIRLRKWFSEKDWEKWDRQIEADSESGKLDFLVREAIDEKAKGKLQEL